MPSTTVRPTGRTSLHDPVSINDESGSRVADAGLGLISDPITVDHPGLPELWPAMTKDQVDLVLTRDMRRCVGVPTTWWGEDHEIVAITKSTQVAAQAADELARRDTGQGYLAQVQTGAAVVGPITAMLVGWPGSDHIDWVTATPDAPHTVDLCVVRPAHPVPVTIDRRTAVVDVAAEIAQRLHEVDIDDGGEPR